MATIKPENYDWIPFMPTLCVSIRDDEEISPSTPLGQYLETGVFRPLTDEEKADEVPRAMETLRDVCTNYKKSLEARKSICPNMRYRNRNISHDIPQIDYDFFSNIEDVMLTMYPVVRHYFYEDTGDNFFAIAREIDTGYLLGYMMNHHVDFVYRTIFLDSEEESAEYLVKDSPYIGKMIAEIVEDFITF